MKDKFNKKDYAKQMKARKDALYERSNDQLEMLLTDPYKFISFLKLMANVNYSVLNSLLVYSVNPHATLVRSIEAWEEKEIHVKDGEEGIEILAPGNEYTRKDGSKGCYFDPKFVFDISQTDRGEVKEYVTKYDMVRTALENYSKIAIVDSSVAGVLYSPDSNEMLVSKELDQDSSLNILFKEFARIETAKLDLNKIEENYFCDCIGFMLSNRYHTGGYDTHLIGSAMDSIFKGKDNSQIKKELNVMYQVYKRMKDAINTEISKQYQEKNE